MKETEDILREHTNQVFGVLAVTKNVARMAVDECKRIVVEKAIEAHRNACPIQVYRMFCPFIEQRKKGTNDACSARCDYMMRFKDEINSIK